MWCGEEESNECMVLNLIFRLCFSEMRVSCLPVVWPSVTKVYKHTSQNNTHRFTDYPYHQDYKSNCRLLGSKHVCYAIINLLYDPALLV